VLYLVVVLEIEFPGRRGLDRISRWSMEWHQRTRMRVRKYRPHTHPYVRVYAYTRAFHHRWNHVYMCFDKHAPEPYPILEPSAKLYPYPHLFGRGPKKCLHLLPTVFLRLRMLWFWNMRQRQWRDTGRLILTQFCPDWPISIIYTDASNFKVFLYK
jgi:hypothetical protein